MFDNIACVSRGEAVPERDRVVWTNHRCLSLRVTRRGAPYLRIQKPFVVR
jgi:hypothetical protein